MEECKEMADPSSRIRCQVALLGTGFCHSARVALGVTLRHPGKMALITSVSLTPATPATHSIWTILKAGETVYQTGHLLTTL